AACSRCDPPAGSPGAGHSPLPQPQGRDAAARQAGAAHPLLRPDGGGVHADLFLPGRGVQRDGPAWAGQNADPGSRRAARAARVRPSWSV
ncbi:MAG: hypothetical protein AVDCRST_MAG19-101, partial [uncultured Thermomicrobiales bacterium]